MKQKLTLEIDNNDESLELHLDKEGAIYLKDLIENLIKHNIDDHIHLMTEEYGGNVSVEKQNISSESKLIHHLKIMYWK